MAEVDTIFDKTETDKLDKEMEKWAQTCENAMKQHEEPPRKKAKQDKEAGKTKKQNAVAKLISKIERLVGEYQLNKGEPLWVPDGTISANTILPTDWNTYIELRQMPADDKAAKCLITDALCFPLTVLNAGVESLSGNVSPTSVPASAMKMDSFVIHILGAEDAECNGLDKWSELLQLLPCIRQLELVMIGPELDEELNGERHVGVLEESGGKKKKKNKSKGEQEDKEQRCYHVEFHTATYHDYIKAMKDEDTFTPPGLVIAFNSGIADFREEWAPTLNVLLDMKVPCCFTSYHAIEADFDARALLHVFGADVKVSAKENPFKSLLPHEDIVNPEKSFYANGYYTLFQGRRQPYEA